MPAHPPDRLRLFFALWPPEPVARTLHEWASRLQATVGGRVMPAQTIHLTLAFLGSIESARFPAAVEAARTVAGPPHAVPIEQCRYWARSRILWVGPRAAPEPLLALAQELRAALEATGFELEARAFAAHVTLIRKARKARRPEAPPALSWPVEAFTLVRSVGTSEGPRYEVLERFAL